MDDLRRYLIICNRETSTNCADQIKINPLSANYKSLTDPRREGYTLFAVVDTDGYVLLTDLYKNEAADQIRVDFPNTIDLN